MKLLLPITIFAGSLAALEWAGNGRITTLPLRAVAVAFVSVWITRRVPWSRLLAHAPVQSRRFRGLLFFLVLGHFVQVLGGEARRCFIARAQCTPRRFGPGWFASLQGALASTIERSLLRSRTLLRRTVAEGAVGCPCSRCTSSRSAIRRRSSFAA